MGCTWWKKGVTVFLVMVLISMTNYFLEAEMPGSKAAKYTKYTTRTLWWAYFFIWLFSLRYDCRESKVD